jgi:hypothetical protein
MMTDDLLAQARAKRAEGYPWKLIARQLDVNVHSLRYHLVAKLNPATVEARKRAYARFAPRRRRRTP